eukprot:gene261-135_t
MDVMMMIGSRIEDIAIKFFLLLLLFYFFVVLSFCCLIFVFVLWRVTCGLVGVRGVVVLNWASIEVNDLSSLYIYIYIYICLFVCVLLIIIIPEGCSSVEWLCIYIYIYAYLDGNNNKKKKKKNMPAIQRKRANVYRSILRCVDMALVLLPQSSQSLSSRTMSRIIFLYLFIYLFFSIIIISSRSSPVTDTTPFSVRSLSVLAMLPHTPTSCCSLSPRRPLLRSRRDITAPFIFASAASLALCVPRRGVVQHTGSSPGHGGGASVGLRSPLDQYVDYQRAKQLSRHARGNVYRYRQKLWPSTVSMEAAWTATMYDTVERTPLHLLLLQDGSSAGTSSAAALTASNSEATSTANEREEEEDVWMLRRDDLRGTPLASLLPHRTAVRDPGGPRNATSDGTAGVGPTRENESGSSCVRLPSSSSSCPVPSLLLSMARAAAAFPSASEPAGTTWTALGLDPAVAGALLSYFGDRRQRAAHPAVPTRLQSRLLPALLHEDHRDVVFHNPKGSGGTTALLVALLQAVQGESAGMNVLVAKDENEVRKATEWVLAMHRRWDPTSAAQKPPAARAAPIPTQRMPHWLYACGDRQEYKKCWSHLQASLRRSSPVRLWITTADIFCEILFEKKMEFEPFGYLRRVYLDDVAEQIPMLADTAPVETVRERLRNPLAAELLLGTLHQLASPHIRSILQLGMVSPGMTLQLRDHLQALCLKPAPYHKVVLSPVEIPSTLHCLFSFYTPLQQKPVKDPASASASASYEPHPIANGGGLQSGHLARLCGGDGTFAPHHLSSSSPNTMLWWSTPRLQLLRQRLQYAAALLWRARAKIPGRVALMVPDGTDLILARQALRAAGVDARLLSEVYRPSGPGGRYEWLGHEEGNNRSGVGGGAAASWRFILLHQHECVSGPLAPPARVLGGGAEERPSSTVIPFLSHVVVCFPPASWQAYLHMANLCTASNRLQSNVGWVWVIADMPAAKDVRRVAEALDIDFIHHTVNERLEAEEPERMDRLTRPPALYGMDPQYAVQQHYEMQAENPETSYRPREFFAAYPAKGSPSAAAVQRQKERAFQREDYTPIPTKMRSFLHAKRLAAEVQRHPEATLRALQKDGMLDPTTLRPTEKLRVALQQKQRLPKKKK